jgi:hypothetical protein
MNIISRILKNALITVLRALRLRTKEYPPKLYHKTRADFIKSIKDKNKGE